MDIKGFKTKDGVVHKYDFESLANKPEDTGGSGGTGGGGGSGADALIVTADENMMASHTPAQIKAHVDSGGIVMAKMGNAFGVLSHTDSTAVFTMSDVDGSNNAGMLVAATVNADKTISVETLTILPDFVVTVDENLVASHTESEIIAQVALGRRVVLDADGTRFEYANNNHSKAWFHRVAFSSEGVPVEYRAGVDSKKEVTAEAIAYEVPMANESAFGGIKAAPATEEMTQEVGITADGRLVTKPGQDSGGNVDLTGYATEQWVQDQKYLTEVPEGYAKTEDIPTKPEDIGALPNTYTPPNQTAEQVGADPKGTATSVVSQHNTADDSHNDIRLELKAINDRLTAFFDSDNQTLDELSEIVAYITSNKTLIDSITTSKVSVTDIINNLTTNVANKPLSAAQGVVMKGLIDAVSNSLANYQPKGDYALRSEIPTVPSKISAFTNDAGYLTQHQDISGKADQTEVDSLSSNQSALSARMDSFTKLGEGSTTGDAELMDARVDCEGKTWSNAGGHIRGITEKIIDACCYKVIVSGGNYNLLKISEVEYSSRLQDGVEGTTSSTASNAVTGWIPVKYGKFYTMSALYGGARVAGSANGNSFFTRMNVKLTDDTIVVYDKLKVPNALVSSKQTMYLEQENAVAVRLHFNVASQDIGSAEKLKAFKPMIVEGDTADEAYNNALNFEYLDGDTEMPAEVTYTPKHDDTKVSKVSLSPYYRNANFGVLPFAYYQGLSDSYESAGFNQNTKYATFIAAWKALVSSHSGYVTETELGKASDGQAIYLYDFKPVQITNQKKPIPKIIIIAGQHGFEKSNIYGLYYFADNLLNRWNQHPALEYLRNHAELLIVPVLNTYGFDTLEYKNANGVNTNRNFDSHWELVSDTTSSDYGGATPFDQPETQIVRDLVQNNSDAVMVVDFHTNGMSSVATYADITLYGVCVSTDDYCNRMLDAVAHHLSAISANFNLDYELNQPNTLMGFLHNGDGTGLLRNWVTDNNITGVLVEGFNGFPNKAQYAPDVFKANEEIIVNWLITALNYLGR